MQRGLCESCWQKVMETHPLGEALGDNALVWRNFDGVMRDAIHAVKFQGRPRLGRELGRRMAEDTKDQLADLAGLVPMPLHAARLRERGYNQSREIALGLADVLRVPLLDGWVERQKNTRQQASLHAEERYENVQGAFVWRRCLAPGQRWGLVDDVMTTGATMRACMAACPKVDTRQLQPVLLARA